MNCTNCGAQLAPGSAFCGQCRQQVLPQPQAFAQPPNAPPQAYPPPQGGQPSPVYPPQGGQPSPVYSPQGYAQQPPGYPPQGQPPQGYPQQPPGYPPQGFAPPPQVPPGYPPQGYQPPMGYGSFQPVAQKEEWRWKWNPLIGITYGPIPIGLIVGGIILIAIYSGH